MAELKDKRNVSAKKDSWFIWTLKQETEAEEVTDVFSF